MTTYVFSALQGRTGSLLGALVASFAALALGGCESGSSLLAGAGQNGPQTALATPPPAGTAQSARVEIAPALKPLLKPEAALFVLARPVAGGPPVAAVRKTAGELPFSISLTDKDVMTEGTKLTQFGELTLVARVSLSGRPQASSGDLFGELRYDFKNGKPVTLIIDRVVP